MEGSHWPPRQARRNVNMAGCVRRLSRVTARNTSFVMQVLERWENMVEILLETLLLISLLHEVAGNYM